jgi:hypothetical protein
MMAAAGTCIPDQHPRFLLCAGSAALVASPRLLPARHAGFMGHREAT